MLNLIEIIGSAIFILIFNGIMTLDCMIKKNTRNFRLSFITISIILSVIATISNKTQLVYVVITVLFESLILFLYIDNPVETHDDDEYMYYRLICRITNYKKNLNLAYSFIGFITNFFILIAANQYNDKIIYRPLSSFLVFISFFWFINLLFMTFRYYHSTGPSLYQAFYIFSNSFILFHTDATMKIEKIKYFKYEMQFNMVDPVERNINIFKKILAGIGILGLDNLIKNSSLINTVLLGSVLISFIILDSLFSNIQNYRNQLFYSLDMYIEKLKEEAASEEKKEQQNKLKKRRTRKRIN